MHHKTIAILKSKSSGGFGFIGSCCAVRLQAFVSRRSPCGMWHVQRDLETSTSKLMERSDVAPRDAGCKILLCDGSHITLPINGSDIRDIMIEGIGRRFTALRAAATIEMLTVNGPPYITKETQIFARETGRNLALRPSAVRSPQCNSISPAILLEPVAGHGSPFVKTLKRPRPGDAAAQYQNPLGLIGLWIEDYNAITRTKGPRCPRLASSLELKTATA